MAKNKMSGAESDASGRKHARTRTVHCDACRHYEVERETVCGKGHYPRLYFPRNPMDHDWGYKRRCAEFEEDPAPR